MLYLLAYGMGFMSGVILAAIWIFRKSDKQLEQFNFDESEIYNEN